MSCRQVRPDVSAYLDGQLSPQQLARVERHLDSCGDCRSFLEEHRHLNQIFRSVPDLEPPPVIWNRIEKRIESGRAAPRVQPSGFWQGLFRPGWAYAATVAMLAILLVSVSLFLFQEGEPSDRQYLADLESFTIEVQQNPFLARSEKENPFFRFGRDSENPFE